MVQMVAREGSRSPRRSWTKGAGRAGGASYGGKDAGASTLPIADLLLQLKVLDEKSVDFLKKAPADIAGQILLDIGPAVRNPSAFVTMRLRELTGGQSSSGHASASRPVASESCPSPNDWEEGEEIQYYHNGELCQMTWASKEQAAEHLQQIGVLDQMSSDYLAKVPESEAKRVIQSLGPDVRNTSAIVTRMLKEAQKQQSFSPMVAGDGGAAEVTGGQFEVITIYHNGEPMQIEFGSVEETVQSLIDSGILDQSSADFLLKVTWEEAKDCLVGLGPDVRNPSAYVTKTLNRILRDRNRGASAYYEAKQSPSWQASTAQAGLQWYPAQASYAGEPEVLIVYQNGEPMELTWVSKNQAVQDLVDCGLLDQGSGSFLMKANEKDAKEIVRLLGPDVRNPSAMVTNKMKAIRNLLS